MSIIHTALWLASNGQEVRLFGGTVHGKLPPRTVPIIKGRRGKGVHLVYSYEPIPCDQLLDEHGKHPEPHSNCEPLDGF